MLMIKCEIIKHIYRHRYNYMSQSSLNDAFWKSDVQYDIRCKYDWLSYFQENLERDVGRYSKLLDARSLISQRRRSARGGRPFAGRISTTHWRGVRRRAYSHRHAHDWCLGITLYACTAAHAPCCHLRNLLVRPAHAQHRCTDSDGDVSTSGTMHFPMSLD